MRPMAISGTPDGLGQTERTSTAIALGVGVIFLVVMLIRNRPV